MSNSTNSKNKVKLNNKNWKIEKLKNWKKKIKIQSCDLSAFTRTGPVNARTCPVNARLSIALTSVNLPCQQLQTDTASGSLGSLGQQHSSWLKSACPIVSLNCMFNKISEDFPEWSRGFYLPAHTCLHSCTNFLTRICVKYLIWSSKFIISKLKIDFKIWLEN